MNQSQYVNTIYSLVNEIAKVKGVSATSFTKITGCSDETRMHEVVKIAYKCTGRKLETVSIREYDGALHMLSKIYEGLVY